MRRYGTAEEDGSREAAECDLCGGTIYQGQSYYRVNGEVICEDCLGDYARRMLAPWRCGEEDEI